ncbi:MAG: MFS transporter [Firmicutes bacterium]|nr:MFS transporter [Bacillota bacterium]
MPRRATSAPLFTLFLVLFTVSVGFGLIIPILPLLARDFGATAFMLGTMTSGYAVVQFLFAPLWGQLSDRVGRKPVLMIGITGMAAAFFFMGLAKSFWALFAARVLGGFLSSATLPAAQAMAAELSGHENRAKAMGLMGAAFGTGFIFGPLIGGLLTPLGPSAPFFAGAAMGALNLLLAARVLQESRGRSFQAEPLAGDPAAGRAVRGPALRNLGRALAGAGRPCYILALVIMFAQSSLMTALALLLADRFGAGSSTLGVIFAVNGAIGGGIQGAAIGPLTDRWGEVGTILRGLAVGVAGYVGIVLAPSLLLCVPAIALTAVSMSLTRPSATSLLSKRTELPQGITMGLQSSFDSLGRVIGPLWAGFAYDWEQSLPFITAAVAFALTWFYFRSLRNEASARTVQRPAKA